MVHKRIGRPLSHVAKSLSKVQKGKRPKWNKRKGETYDHYLGRIAVWNKGQQQKKKSPKPKKKLTEYQKRIKARKEAEKQLGLKRGIKKKKKK